MKRLQDMTYWKRTRVWFDGLWWVAEHKRWCLSGYSSWRVKADHADDALIQLRDFVKECS